jgi:hypothetical protein
VDACICRAFVVHSSIPRHNAGEAHRRVPTTSRTEMEHDCPICPKGSLMRSNCDRRIYLDSLRSDRRPIGHLLNLASACETAEPRDLTLRAPRDRRLTLLRAMRNRSVMHACHRRVARRVGIHRVPEPNDQWMAIHEVARCRTLPPRDFLLLDAECIFVPEAMDSTCITGSGALSIAQVSATAPRLHVECTRCIARRIMDSVCVRRRPLRSVLRSRASRRTPTVRGDPTGL